MRLLPASGEEIRQSIIFAEDLPRYVPVVATVVLLAGLILLFFELRRAEKARRAIVVAVSILAAVAMFLAIVRPQRLNAREVRVAPRVVVLLDRSRSMALPSTKDPTSRSRMDVAEQAVTALRTRLGGRVDVLSFGSGDPTAVEPDPKALLLERADQGASDLGAALRKLDARSEDPPAAIVVVSDGRLAPMPVEPGQVARAVMHAVAIGDGSPPDAAIRSVNLAGAAVAHQKLPVRVEVACTGGLDCGDISVAIREIREGTDRGTSRDSSPSKLNLLASGTAHTNKDGLATIELPIVLEHAGTRAIEVSLVAPRGDMIPENDQRLLTLDVARERVRVLHIAGRPTYDVRALRTWLKSDAAIDVVSFFILRTPGDEVNAPDEELALIPFPVRELFTEYLPTFDVVLFQDFDAEPYGLTPHLPAIAKYVEQGGGLIHLGGQNAFSAGGYAGTPLAKVSPAEILKVAASEASADGAPFVPLVNPAARSAPILADLLALTGDGLPEFAGTSLLGDVRKGGIALLSHPTRKTASGKPMPVLAIADVGDGRSIALGLDSTFRLQFSSAATKSGGRAYDALWRGLLGWLMRDPRYEPLRGRLVDAHRQPPCLAGAKASLRVDAAPQEGNGAQLRVRVRTLEPYEARTGEGFTEDQRVELGKVLPAFVPLGTAPFGALAVRLSLNAPTGSSADLADSSRSSDDTLGSRILAVCERGGDEWSDPRPDRERLELLTKGSGGRVVGSQAVAELPIPNATIVSLERRIAPILPTWAWAAIAAMTLSGLWIVRRRNGLS